MAGVAVFRVIRLLFHVVSSWAAWSPALARSSSGFCFTSFPPLFLRFGWVFAYLMCC